MYDPLRDPLLQVRVWRLPEQFEEVAYLYAVKLAPWAIVPPHGREHEAGAEQV